MGKLQQVRSPLGSIASPLRPAPMTRRERDAYRDESEPWRRLYKTARWQRLVVRIRQREGDICQQTGEMLAGDGRTDWNGPVVDHIIPARVFWFDGRRALFWDEGNLQLVAKWWHDQVKQAQEKSRRY